MTTDTQTVTPKVWIGCLAAYNAGKLHGEWVDAAVEEDEIWEAQRRVLASSPEPGAEEHFIADHEGFAPYRIGEYDSLTRVALVARMIEEHGVAFAAWLANDDSVLDGADEHDLEQAFDEAYRGEWDSEKDFAENLVEELGLPGVGFVYKQTGGYAEQYAPCLDEISAYIDWDGIARDLFLSGDYWSTEVDGKTLVFESS